MRRHKPDDVHYGGKSPCWKHDGEPLDTSSWTDCTCGVRVVGATADEMVEAWNVHRAIDGRPWRSKDGKPKAFSLTRPLSQTPVARTARAYRERNREAYNERERQRQHARYVANRDAILARQREKWAQRSQDPAFLERKRERDRELYRLNKERQKKGAAA